MEKLAAGSSIGCGEVTQGKHGAAGTACVAGHCTRENPAWFMYAANGNISFCLKTDRLIVTHNLDI